MAKNATPIAGVDFATTQLAADGPRFAVGLSVNGDDGHRYVYAQASGAITTQADCVLTQPAFTMAAGAGAWVSPVPAMATGDYGWFQEKSIT